MICAVWDHQPPRGDVAIERHSPFSVEPLRHALYEAAYWRGDPRPSLYDGLSDPHLAVYIEDWGRQGDAAVMARDSTAAIGGAAWFRLFTEARHGYGFINDAIPEVGIGVAELWRGLGIGTRLLTALHAEAQECGITRLSLSVEHDNPARQLYKRLGYTQVSAASGSVTMLLELKP